MQYKYVLFNIKQLNLIYIYEAAPSCAFDVYNSSNSVYITSLWRHLVFCIESGAFLFTFLRNSPVQTMTSQTAMMTSASPSPTRHVICPAPGVWTS